MINKVILEGRLTKEVEVRATNNGKKVAYVNIALNRGKDSNGNDLGADFVTVKAWEKRAEMVANWFHKGDGIVVEGHLNSNSWDENGVKKFSLDVLADRITFTESSKGTSQPITTSSQQAATFDISPDDDLPF